MIELPLSDEDLRLATNTGQMRHSQTHKVAACKIPGTDHLSEQNHIQGAIAELAIARYYDLPWTLENRFNRDTPSDVGQANLQVRSSRSPSPSLTIHPGDDPHDYYLLVAVRPRTRFLVGGAHGHRIRKGLPIRYGNGTTSYALQIPQLDPPITRIHRDSHLTNP